MAKIQLPLRLGRTFQLWSYQVSHGVVLLRSNREVDNPTRLDVMFRGVSELQLRSHMDGILVGLGDSGGSIDVGRGRYLFDIEASGWHGYIVARNLFISEDDLDYGEPSSIDNRDLAAHVVRSDYWE